MFIWNLRHVCLEFRNGCDTCSDNCLHFVSYVVKRLLTV